MSEEEDYMSDSFLVQSESVRPGLRDAAQKRRDRATRGGEGAPKVKKAKRSEKEVAEERRETGLATPLSASNKGFSLLQKMGYKAGMGLGKTGDGRTAPIPLVVKQGRVGLGREVFVQEGARRKEEARARESARRRGLEVSRTERFHQRTQEVFSRKKITADLWKSQLACQQLDTEMGVCSPEHNWFWPAGTLAEVEDEEEEEEEDLEPSAMLELLTQYLRSTHYYCIWCGTAYDGPGDMDTNCPGDSEQAHD